MRRTNQDGVSSRGDVYAVPKARHLMMMMTVDDGLANISTKIEVSTPLGSELLHSNGDGQREGPLHSVIGPI